MSIPPFLASSLEVKGFLYPTLVKTLLGLAVGYCQDLNHEFETAPVI